MSFPEINSSLRVPVVNSDSAFPNVESVDIPVNRLPSEDKEKVTLPIIPSALTVSIRDLSQSIMDNSPENQKNNLKVSSSLIDDNTAIFRNQPEERKKSSIPIKVIKLEDIQELDKPTIKKLKGDYSYKIEVEIINNHLNLKIYEICIFCPFYYEVCYSKNDLETKVSKAFRIHETIEESKNEILKLIPNKTSEIRKEEKNGKIKMILKILINVLADEDVPIEFELEEKIIEDSEKDRALRLLYEKEKELDDKLKKIKKLCGLKKGTNDLALNILDIIQQENI